MTTTIPTAFLDAYIEAALWSSIDEQPDGNGGPPMDDNHGPEDLPPATLLAMTGDCIAFLAVCEAKGLDLDECDRGQWSADECAGHDFWLTRNGHGVGFWDRDLGQLGDDLTDTAQRFGEVWLYVGDDGMIYQS